MADFFWWYFDAETAEYKPTENKIENKQYHEDRVRNCSVCVTAHKLTEVEPPSHKPELESAYLCDLCYNTTLGLCAHYPDHYRKITPRMLGESIWWLLGKLTNENKT